MVNKESKTNTNTPNGLQGSYNAAYDSTGDAPESNTKLGHPTVITLATVQQEYEKGSDSLSEIERNTKDHDRPTWGSSVEFLMSCISLSVGIGNIWRFPFTAYENGGGAFVLPYIFVLIIIGRPMYYLEMSIGQFMSKGMIKIWECAPLMKGIGMAQVMAIFFIVSYYAVLLALTFSYLVASFSAELPWAVCKPEWGEYCIPSRAMGNETGISPNETVNGTGLFNLTSSSELYFLRDVLHEKDSIDDGIGLPDIKLTCYLFLAWTVVFLVMVRGVKSSGKASYFLALFPYFVMSILLVKALTLPGSMDGISYFLTPRWEELLEPVVWRKAVEQCFFSLSVALGPVIMFSSYNQFDHNIYRDATIVAFADTCTSLVAGVTIFGILGNLAHNLEKPVELVVKSGTGLAFISYPDAIAKFEYYPQVFSVLFFCMLFTLGIGSCVGLTQAAVTSIWDHFSHQKFWKFALGGCIIGFLSGLVYVTPGGQWMLTLVDSYGGTFLVLAIAIFEMVTLMWIYGLDEICTDIEFMTKRKLGVYWRLCWSTITPICMIFLFVLALYSFTAPEYSRKPFPEGYYVFGWCCFMFGMFQIPVWFAYGLEHRVRSASILEGLSDGLSPSPKWGPKSLNNKLEWIKYKKEVQERRRKLNENNNYSLIRRKINSIFRLD